MGYFGIPFRNGVPIGLGSIVGFGAPQEFSPSELFLGGTAGAWYDPSDLSTMFTTSAGTTPVAMPGQGSAVSVGLMLDKSQGLVLGPELVTNGGPGFTATTGWAASGATVNASGGKLVCAVTSAGPSVYWTLTTVIGTWYQVNIVWENVNATNPSILVNSTGGLSITTTNTNATVYFCAVATSTFVQMLLGSGGPTTNTRIISLSAKTIAGNHAIAFNNTTARPELRARVNLLTYSEEFDNAAWTKANVNISTNSTAAPNGTITAEAVTPTTASAQHYINSAAGSSLTAGASYKQALSAKANGYSFLVVAVETVRACFDLSSGTVTGTSGSVSASISSAGNGWWNCSITWSSAGGTQLPFFIINDINTTATRTFSGDGTSGIYIWSADLRPANIGANVPAYQRIADANTYDTSGFPLYLRFDGIDDSMYTPANLNLSGTDKVAVFAGVRKLSDAAAGMVTELASFLLNGTFNLAAPSANVALGANFGPAVRGNGATSYGEDAGSNPAPKSAVLTSSYDLAAVDKIDFRINGATASVVNNGGVAGTGNFGAYPLFIGARNNASIWFNGHLHSLIIAGSAVSAGNISATEQWVAGKTGIVI